MRSSVPRPLVAAAALVGLALLSAGAAAQRRPDDAELTRRVRAALEAGERVIVASDLAARAAGRSDLAVAREATLAVRDALGDDVTGLFVSSRRGRIELSGQVADADAARRALGLAAATRGAVSVVPRLRLPDGALALEPTIVAGDDPSAPFPFVTGDLLAGRGMTVTVDAGIVRLGGTVNGRPAAEHAVRTARAVRGVRAVDRRALEVRSGGAVDDLGLALLVHHELATRADLHPVAGRIEVIARGGAVRLSGTVDTEVQRDLAELLTVALDRVLLVDGRLVVDPQARSRAAGRPTPHGTRVTTD